MSTKRTEPAALDDADRDLLLGALPRTRIPSERRQALQHRVMQVRAPGDGDFVLVTAEHDDWRQLLPGLKIKPLRVDPIGRTQTSLWKLEPGAVVPEHDHHAEEECLILDGSIVWDDRVYSRGDYLLARPGGKHSPFVSPTGALLLIRSELTEPLQRLFAG